MATCFLCNNYLSREWAISLQHLTTDIWNHQSPRTPPAQLAWLNSVRALIYTPSSSRSYFSAVGVYEVCGHRSLIEVENDAGATTATLYVCYGKRVNSEAREGEEEVCFPLHDTCFRVWRRVEARYQRAYGKKRRPESMNMGQIGKWLWERMDAVGCNPQLENVYGGGWGPRLLPEDEKVCSV